MKLDINSLIKNIDQAAKYDFDNKKVFGSAYYVFQEGNLEIEKCYGEMSLDTDAPITNTTLFRLASMTKPITAVAALILISRGLLSLDDTIDKYLPEFKNIHVVDFDGKDYMPKNIPTIRNLLNHSSGLGCNYDKMTDITDADRQTIDSLMAKYLKWGLDFEPGTKQMYSGVAAFSVLTKIIELVSGCDYLDFLKKEIFEPCDMPNTTFVPSKAQREQLVKMHNRIDDKNKVHPMPEGCVFESYPETNYLGGAGLISNLHDYCNFAKMLLNKGKFGDKVIVPEEVFVQMSTPQISEEIMPGDARWGLGVRVISKDSYPWLPVGAFGWSGAYGSHFWIDPVNKIFAVYMKNSRVDGGSANESARKFESAVYSSFADEE